LGKIELIKILLNRFKQYILFQQKVKLFPLAIQGKAILAEPFGGMTDLGQLNN